MRIVIDLQGAQSSSSGLRGIGRYSIAFISALIRNRKGHEIILVLSDKFPESITRIKESLRGLISDEQIKVWGFPGSLDQINKENDSRRRAAEVFREGFLEDLNPDFILITSLFEGLTDNAVTSIGKFESITPVGVVLYDLIPLIRKDVYLSDEQVSNWYFEKKEMAQKSAVLFAISESTRIEALEHLGSKEESTISISSDVDSEFKRLQVAEAEDRIIRQRFGIHLPFIMYTGGIDFRKNIEGLIKAFSLLPESVQSSYQLVIVCQITESQTQELMDLAARLKLKGDSLVITGYVQDDDLVLLYNLCELFVMPSLHEGFGLPLLEAMRCGAPVIGSNSSSIPEVIGLRSALFDPYSPEDISRVLEKALLDSDFRSELLKNSEIQSKKFSWDQTGRKAIEAIEANFGSIATSARCKVSNVGPKPLLAVVSPLPPEKTGIAGYTRDLLDPLSEFYRIELVTNQLVTNFDTQDGSFPVISYSEFEKEGTRFDRVLYHFGNSSFHSEMVSLIKKIPGVVVLHDFYLSGLLNYVDHVYPNSKEFKFALLESHGYDALASYERDLGVCVQQYPASQTIIDQSVGVIFHSAGALEQAKRRYGTSGGKLSLVPLLRKPARLEREGSATASLDLDEDLFLVTSFGHLASSKYSDVILSAWVGSKLFRDPKCRLVFVGENPANDFGAKIQQQIALLGSGANVTVSGWISDLEYDNYLQRSDLSIQLRNSSRGETSAAVLDAMSYGIPVIVNEHGSLSELPSEAVYKIRDEFSETELVNVLEKLWEDASSRECIGKTAKELINREHNPRRCAVKYFEDIERFYSTKQNIPLRAAEQILQLSSDQGNHADSVWLSQTFADYYAVSSQRRQLLIDVSAYLYSVPSLVNQEELEALIRWLLYPPEFIKVEPVIFSEIQGLVYARKWTLELLGLSGDDFYDQPADIHDGDICVVLRHIDTEAYTSSKKFYDGLGSRGVTVSYLETGKLRYPPEDFFEFDSWLFQ